MRLKLVKEKLGSGLKEN